MEQLKTRSVGACAHRTQPTGGKALMGLMLSLALVGLTACGQKRPLQLPSPAKTAGTGAAAPSAAPMAAPSAKAEPASAPASAAKMPQR